MLYLYFIAERKMYDTTLDTNLLRKLKILAAQINNRNRKIKLGLKPTFLLTFSVDDR